MDADPQLLNEAHAIPGHISFHAGPNNLITASIHNAHAQAAVTLHGAHVMSYQPNGDAEVLWESPYAAHRISAAMRGGIPICWPWFAGHPSDPSKKPHHGFVRNMLWRVTGCAACPDGSTELRMAVHDTPETREIWPHAFELETIITVGKKLRIEWIARSFDGDGYSYTGALHPYFYVSDIRAITIRGLEQSDYLDKNDQYRRKTQGEPFKITKEFDGIFLDTTAEIAIQDPGFGRTIHCDKEGSHTTVVWNPDQKDRLMPDVGEGEHQRFVCVESANAAEDIIAVKPGAEGRLAMIIWTERGGIS
jgi:glucose-6-phosphate 1-epimerase